MFELPPLKSFCALVGLIQGMDKKHDGPPWCRTKNTNIKNNDGLKFKHSSCVGHVSCQNLQCVYYVRNNADNETNGKELQKIL